METQTNTPQNKSRSSIGGFFWDLFKIFVIAFAITAPFRLLIAEPFVVSGSSMVPSFENHDYLIVDRFSYRSGEPKRGDVLVFKYPKDPSQYFIKRVIGLPGETVKIEQGHVVVINKQNPEGFVLKEPYLKNEFQTLGVAGRQGSLTLGSEEYFVLGDNRTASSDSRVWGVLPKEDIVGKAFLRVFPINEFGVIKTPTY